MKYVIEPHVDRLSRSQTVGGLHGHHEVMPVSLSSSFHVSDMPKHVIERLQLEGYCEFMISCEYESLVGSFFVIGSCGDSSCNCHAAKGRTTYGFRIQPRATRLGAVKRELFTAAKDLNMTRIYSIGVMSPPGANATLCYDAALVAGGKLGSTIAAVALTSYVQQHLVRVEA